MADPQGTGSQPTPNTAAPGANGADPNATPAPAVVAPTAPPAQANQPEPVTVATRAGSTDYRQRTIGRFERAGLPVVKDDKGNVSLNKSIEEKAKRIKELEQAATSASGLSETEKARLTALEQQNALLKAQAEAAEQKATQFILRQKVASAISGLETHGALDTAIDKMLADYEIVVDANGTEYARYQNQPLMNGVTGQPMTLREVAAHMMARYGFLAKPGAAPGVMPIGSAVTGDDEARLMATTDPAERFALGQKVKQGLKGR